MRSGDPGSEGGKFPSTAVNERGFLLEPVALWAANGGYAIAVDHGGETRRPDGDIWRLGLTSVLGSSR